MNKKSLNTTIKVFLFIFIPTLFSNLISSLIGIPNEKRYVGVHTLQYDIIWIITCTAIFFILGLHKKD